MGNLEVTAAKAITEEEAAIINECPYCPDTLYTFDTGDYDLVSSYEYFHKPCPAPICSQPVALKSALCDSCQHLRLWHLLICMQWRRGYQFEVNLERKFRKDQFMTKTCSFCRLIQPLLLPGTYDPAVLETGDPLIMEDDEHETCLQLSLTNLGEQKPETTVTVFVDSGASILRTPTVGALQVVMGECKNHKKLVGEMIEWSRIRKVVQACSTTHSLCQGSNMHRLPEGFRVIDVAQRCIVEKAQCDFVALSYVWGSDTSMITYTTNIEERRCPGSLSSDKMPQTLEDALEACEHLQEKYLWIDRLCIIQNDPEDKARQIGVMDTIYSAARFVIMNTYGNGATYGIPGVSRPRCVVQSTAQLPGMTVTNQVRETGKDPLNTWTTRGWTYQEAVLGTRKLYFTNRRVYYECEQSILHEDAYNDDTTLRYKYLRLHFQHYSMQEYSSGFTAYTRHVRQYSVRCLTFRSDVYAAFSGVMNTLFGSATLYHGLPSAHFDRSLLWFTMINRNETMDREECGVAFPSWSWYSYMRPDDEIKHQHNRFHGALVAWYGYDNESNEVLALNEEVDTCIDQDWRLLMHLTFSEMGIPDGGTVTLAQRTWADVHAAATKRWPDYSMFYKELSQFADRTTTIARQIRQKIPGAILGRAQIAHFALDAKDAWANILNIRGEKVGQLYGVTPHIATRTNIQEGAEVEELHRFEFMALSVFGKDKIKVSVDEWDHKRHTDSQGERIEEVPMIQVMLVAWNGPVAHREALGWVYLLDWAAAVREWKTIILQ